MDDEQTEELDAHLETNEALWAAWTQVGDIEHEPFAVSFHFTALSKKVALAHIDRLKTAGFEVEHSTERYWIFFTGHDIVASLHQLWTLDKLQQRTREMYEHIGDTSVMLQAIEGALQVAPR